MATRKWARILLITRLVHRYRPEKARQHAEVEIRCVTLVVAVRTPLESPQSVNLKTVSETARRRGFSAQHFGEYLRDTHRYLAALFLSCHHRELRISAIES